MAKKLFSQTAAFKRLHATWMKKLAEARFDDIEDGKFIDLENGEDGSIIRPEIIKTQKSQYDGGNSYYELCQEIIREFKFKRPVDKTIFELHASGKSLREIATWLEKSKSHITMTAMGIQKLVTRIKNSYINGEK